MNPLGHLLAVRGVLSALSTAARQTVTGREFFPDLISGPFRDGLVVVFALATALTVLAALASALRGGRHVPSPDSTQHQEPGQHPEPGEHPEPGQHPKSGQQPATPAKPV